MTIKERIAFHRSRADVETDLAPQLTRILALVEEVRAFEKTELCWDFAKALDWSDVKKALAAMEAAGDIEPTPPPIEKKGFRTMPPFPVAGSGPMTYTLHIEIGRAPRVVTESGLEYELIDGTWQPK